MFYFDPVVQLAMDREIVQIMGSENRDDAKQEAYAAIADEQPLTVEDACLCAKRAIGRYRKRIINEEYHYAPFEGGKGYADNGNHVVSDDAFGTDYIPLHSPSGIDLIQPDTDRPPNRGPAYYKAQMRVLPSVIEAQKMERDKQEYFDRIRNRA